MTPFFIANWKMNMLRREAQQFVQCFREIYTPTAPCEVGIAPPTTALGVVAEELASLPDILLGCQTIHWLPAGAHTGEISPPMLEEYGVRFAIIGHSERRHLYRETDAEVSRRARGAITAGIRACVCIGETREQYERGETLAVISHQLTHSLAELTPPDLSSLVICYEPVWAIGTGLAATPEQVAGVHQAIRDLLNVQFRSELAASIRILYGGSVSASNIGSFMSLPHVSGAIVGTASLDPEKFALLVQNGCEGRS